MVRVKRFPANPILSSNKDNDWEAEATFNGSVIKAKDKFYLCYRAVSQNNFSTVGQAVSADGIHFKQRQQFIRPEYEWEKFGCEDPRITRFEDKYYIFYTALSDYPFTPSGIKVGLAVTTDLQKIEAKYQVTTFNSKAMTLFPERINGKIAAILTANTDLPPAKIALAFFNQEKEIYSQEYWQEWYAKLDSHSLSFTRSVNDHVEVGAPPLKTKDGWLLIYCYIYNYFSPPSVFAIEAVLLDLKEPTKIIGSLKRPLLTPQKDYELYGHVQNIVFPSGAIVVDGELRIYYGAADTTCCLATCQLDELLTEIKTERKIFLVKLERFKDNPMIMANKNNSWESKATFNPTAIYLNHKVHLLYRAMSEDNVSTIGYTASSDGKNFGEKTGPIYKPRELFEMKLKPGNSGCEDARITLLNDRLYLCYTAFDAVNPSRVAFTSIAVEDFLNKNWNWEKPKLISSPGVWDKNAALLPEKIDDKYVFFHRLENCIWVDFVDNLEFGNEHWIKGKIIIRPNPQGWDTDKVGIAAPPLKTKNGWLLIYHGISKEDKKYRLGAALLDLADPKMVLSRLDYPLIEPEKNYEIDSGGRGIIFSCGAVIIKDELLVYYGGADEVVCGASLKLNDLLQALD